MNVKTHSFTRWALLGVALLTPLGYYLLNHSVSRVHVLATPLDRLIPLVPVFAVPYLAFLPIYWATVVWSFAKGRGFTSLAVATIVTHVVSFSVYAIYQTYVPRPVVSGSDIFSDLVRLIYRIDQPYNCMPSLHTADAVVFMRYLVHYEQRQARWAILFGMAVIAATLLLHQHFIIDVLSGAALGLVAFYLGRIAEKKSRTSKAK